MKKYQFWLERKNYSQHLNNLLRIKLTSSLEKLRDKTNFFQGSSRLDVKDKQIKRDMSSFCLTSKDLSYIITARQLQNHKMRLVRSNEIVRQNQEMVKRINNAKPFINNSSRPVSNNNYKLKRKMQRSNEKQDQLLKSINYKEFRKVQNQNEYNVHKYKLIVIVQEHELLIASHKCTELFIELVSNKVKRKSSNVSPSEFNHFIFKFSSAEALPEEICLNVHQLKNLDHSLIESYTLRRPSEGKTQEFCLQNKMGYNKIRFKIRYVHLKPKFYAIDHFKI